MMTANKLAGYRAAAAAGVLLAILVATPAPADEVGLERFSISVGAFLTYRDTYMRLDGEVPRSGTPTDFEKDLGFDKSDTVIRLDSYVRFSDRHRIDFSVFDLSRSATRQVIDRDIEWNGEVFPVNVEVDSSLDMRISKLAYTWSFLQRDKGFVGASAGLYVADTRASLKADSLGRVAGGSVTAPLPVVGFRGQYELSDKWTLRGNAEVFALEYGDYSGSLYDTYAGLDYQLFKQMAIGLGVNTVRINVRVDKSVFRGDLDWRYSGGLLFFKFDF